MNVFLTPSAKLEAEKLLKFLRENVGLEHTSRGFERPDGTVLSEEEIDFAKKHGILRGNFLQGTIITDKFFKASSNINYIRKEIKTDSYGRIADYFGKTEKERKDYYEKHKSDFYQINGTLYEGSSHVKFGTIGEDGSIKFYSDQEFKHTYESEGGKTGLDENGKIISIEEEKNLASSAGIISRDFASNLVSRIANYDKKAKVSGQEISTAVNGSFAIIDGVSKISVPYNAFYYSSGAKYKVDTKALGNVTGSEYIYLKEIEAKSLEELRNKVIEKINHHRTAEESKKASKYTGVIPEQQLEINEENNLDSMANELISNGIRIKQFLRSDGKGSHWLLENGQEFISKPLRAGKTPSQSWINQINSQIFIRQKQVKESETIRMYNESGLKSQHLDFIKKANEDIGSVREENGFAVNEYGDIYGKIEKDKDGNITKVIPLSEIKNRKEASEVIIQSAVNPINNDDLLRTSFYQMSMGLKTMGQGDQKGSYKEIKVGGKKYYVRVNTDTDINSFLSGGAWSATDGGIQVLEDGQFKNVSETEMSEVWNEINEQMSKLVDTQGLTREAIMLLTDKNVQAAIEAANQRYKQEMEIIKQTASSERQELYLKTLAESAENWGELQEAERNRINSEEQQKSQEAGNKRDQAIAGLVKPKDQPSTTGVGPLKAEKDNLKFGWHKSGGFTATGDSDDEVAGIVHRNEWVASASLTRKYKPFFELLDKYQNPEVNKIDINAPETKTPNSESAPSYVNTGGNVINSGNTTIINNGGGGEYGGRRNTLSGTCTNDFGYNSSVGGKNRVNGGH